MHSVLAIRSYTRQKFLGVSDAKPAPTSAGLFLIASLTTTQIHSGADRPVARNGRAADTQMIDSTHVKAHRSASGGKRESRSRLLAARSGGRNTKIHALADVRGASSPQGALLKVAFAGLNLPILCLQVGHVGRSINEIELCIAAPQESMRRDLFAPNLEWAPPAGQGQAAYLAVRRVC